MAINFLLHKETRVEGIIDGEVVENFINEAIQEKNINYIPIVFIPCLIIVLILFKIIFKKKKQLK